MDDSQNVAPDQKILSTATDIGLVDAEVEDEALSLKVTCFLRLCWAWRGMVFGILATGILLSLLLALSQPNKYTSTTALMPPDKSSSYSSLMGLLTSASPAAGLGSAALGISTPGELFVSILQSRNVLDSLITRFDLVHYYDVRIMEDARKSLEGDTRIVQDRKSGIITVSVTVKNPVLASRIARAYVEELNRVVTDNSTSAARRERIFLEGRLKDVKQQLDASAKSLSQFSAKNKTIDMPSQARSMMEAGLKLQTELIDGRSQLAALRQTYSEDNSRVRAIEARNAALQREIDKMGGSSKDANSNGSSNQSNFPAADQLPALGVTYYDLERTVHVDEALWEALTKQYEAAKVEEAEAIPSVRVLDAANVPERKSSSSRRLIMEIGTLLSIVIACIAVFTARFWQEIDAQTEPKKLVLEVAGFAFNPEHRFWKLPGMRWIHKRLEGTG